MRPATLAAKPARGGQKTLFGTLLMPRQKLTQKVVDRLPAPDPSGRQVLHWDTELKGLGVLCSGTTTARSFIVQRDLVGGRTRRLFRER